MSETPHENDPRRPDDSSRIQQPELDPNRPESGKWENVGENRERRYNQETGQWGTWDTDTQEWVDGNYKDDETDSSVAQTEEIQFLNGNRNAPVLFLGDDPSNETNETDNVLVVLLGTAQSVPRDSVSKEEGTPEQGERER